MSSSSHFTIVTLRGERIDSRGGVLTSGFYEKGWEYFKEGTKSREKAKLLLNNADYAGSVRASQSAVDLYIKGAYLLHGREPPRNLSPSSDFKEIVKMIKETPTQDLNLSKEVTAVTKRFQGIHAKNMYGAVGKKTSQLFDKGDTFEYYHLANDLGLLIVAIDSVYRGRHNQSPR